MKSTNVEFTRYNVPIEIRFTGGQECCEWCNMAFMNMKRHFECSITHEEMVAPKEAIGFFCPLRKEVLEDG